MEYGWRGAGKDTFNEYELHPTTEIIALGNSERLQAIVILCRNDGYLQLTFTSSLGRHIWCYNNRLIRKFAICLHRGNIEVLV